MIKYAHERAAVSILKWLAIAEGDLIGCELAIGRAGESVVGRCKKVRLDDGHGLSVHVEGSWYPVSAITRMGPKRRNDQ